MVPQAAAVQPAPETDQVTVVMDEPVTVAEKDWVAEAVTEAEVGFTLTDTGAGAAEIVTAAEADLVASATLVAFTETVAGDGGVAGAV